MDQAQILNYVIQRYKKEGMKTDDISDGYHTFEELYNHRNELFILACFNRAELAKHPGSIVMENPVWRSKLHSDGSSYEGWFIAGMYYGKGNQISYHLPMNLWERMEFAVTLEKAPEWDGHSSSDVLTRLKNLHP